MELSNKGRLDEALAIFQNMLEEFPDKTITYAMSSIFWSSKKDFFHRPEIQEKIKTSKVYDYILYYLKSYELITE